MLLQRIYRKQIEFMAKIQIRVNDVRLSLRKEQTLKECLAEKLRIKKNLLQNVQVLHRGIDARRKNNICLLYHVTVEIDVTGSLQKSLLNRPGVTVFAPAEPESPA